MSKSQIISRVFFCFLVFFHFLIRPLSQKMTEDIEVYGTSGKLTYNSEIIDGKRISNGPFNYAGYGFNYKNRKLTINGFYKNGNFDKKFELFLKGPVYGGYAEVTAKGNWNNNKLDGFWYIKNYNIKKELETNQDFSANVEAQFEFRNDTLLSMNYKNLISKANWKIAGDAKGLLNGISKWEYIENGVYQIEYYKYIHGVPIWVKTIDKKSGKTLGEIKNYNDSTFFTENNYSKQFSFFSNKNPDTINMYLIEYYSLDSLRNLVPKKQKDSTELIDSIKTINQKIEFNNKSLSEYLNDSLAISAYIDSLSSKMITQNNKSCLISKIDSIFVDSLTKNYYLNSDNKKIVKLLEKYRIKENLTKNDILFVYRNPKFKSPSKKPENNLQPNSYLNQNIGVYGNPKPESEEVNKIGIIIFKTNSDSILDIKLIPLTYKEKENIHKILIKSNLKIENQISSFKKSELEFYYRKLDLCLNKYSLMKLKQNIKSTSVIQNKLLEIKLNHENEMKAIISDLNYIESTFERYNFLKKNLINANVIFVKRDDCQKKYNYQDECDPLRSLLSDGLKFETLFQEGIGKRVSSIITPKLAEITVFK